VTGAPAERLLNEPGRFDFFQAVRLLAHVHRIRATRDPSQRRGPVGRDESPDDEVVRFRAVPSLRFPPAPVASVAEVAGRREGSTRFEMSCAFLGVVGPSGALPDHYTSLLIRRLRVRDRALSSFLDIFHHRTISLFHRAWEKYRFPFRVESAASAGAGAPEDLAAWAVFCLTGRGTARTRGRTHLHDDVFASFAGLFSRTTRPAVGLEALLTAYFELPVTVEQFEPEWLLLEVADRTLLPTSAEPRGRHNQLGRDTILGHRRCDAQGRFRLRVGPVAYAVYREFMPVGSLLEPFCELTRAYAGPELAFDVQPVLAPREAPPCHLGGERPDRPHLGWNTWLRSQPVDREFDGIRFSLDRV
jgi:type VI secretion system protein ImpH